MRQHTSEIENIRRNFEFRGEAPTKNARPPEEREEEPQFFEVF